MIITSEAIVLHSRKYSDSSNILTLYTPDRGKVSVIAKGSRKPKSKFGAAVMPLGIISATYYFKPGRDLQTLSNAETVVPLRVIGESFEHLTTGLAIAESVNSTTHPDEQNAELYDLLKQSLVALNTAGQNTYAYFVWFTLRLAEVTGFMIDLHHCAETQLPIVAEPTPEYYFSFADGSPYSQSDSTVQSGYRLTGVTLALLQTIAQTGLDDVRNIPVSEQLRNEIHHFFTNYFSFHLERRFVYRTQKMVLGNFEL
ncbi:MAG: DNA repair protein RecO [Candidatus Kapabacteria bacterium]|nr:DNA repair protein RecO [Candidatus Kapabacteria bacterium]